MSYAYPGLVAVCATCLKGLHFRVYIDNRHNCRPLDASRVACGDNALKYIGFDGETRMKKQVVEKFGPLLSSQVEPFILSAWSYI